MLKRTAVIMAACLFLVMLCAAPALAAETVMNYEDYVTNIEVDGDNDLVTLSLPVSGTEWQVYRGGGLWLREFGVDRVSWVDEANYTYDVYAYPMGNGVELSLDNIPDNSMLYMSFVSSSIGSGYNSPTISVQCYYNDAAGNIISYVQYNHGTTHIDDEYGISVEIDKPAGAVTCWLRASFNGYRPLNVGQTMGVRMKSYELMLSISSLYRMQQEMGKTNEILGEVEQQLEKNGQTLEEILQKQEELPGQIGDEMQGIIDNEKQDATNSGDKFVDQILDALPDPSTQVLASLKSLTDATSYTGTDAKLQIPALVMPAVGSLIPETVLWSGAEFDMGSYMDLLPETLVTVVQSLFTIAIVLYCVYELIGLISFCLTLRGGGVNG